MSTRGRVRTAALLALIPLGAVALPAQTRSAWDSLTPGPYPVGFGVTQIPDPTRIGPHGQRRVVSLSVWYPASGGGTPMRFLDYARQYAAEAGSDSLLIERFRQGFAPEVPSLAVARLMASPVLARGGASRHATRRPLVLYAPGAGGSPLTHVITCEYLASYGYAVASLPATGADGFGQTFDLEGQTALERDLALALAALRDLDWIDTGRVSAIGFSFGANPALLLAMRDPGIRALVSLEGALTFRNATPILRASTDLSPLGTSAALLRLEAAPDPTQDSAIVDGLAASDQLIVRLPGADHHDVISRGVLLEVATQHLAPEARARYRLTLELTRRFLDSTFGDSVPLMADSLIVAFRAAKAQLSRRPARTGRITRDQLVGALIAAGGARRLDSLQRLAGRTPILSSGTYQLVASRLLDSGRKRDAGAVLDLALRSFPRDPNLHAARGMVYLALGDRNSAASSFARALAIDPLNLYALEGREQLARPAPGETP